jgi:hypothetical protein
VASPFETGATPQEKAANLLRRHENYQTVIPPSGKLLTELPLGAQANTCRVLLEKDTLHLCVEERLKVQGVNTNDLQEPIDGLVERMLAPSLSLDYEAVMQGLEAKIRRGHQTPQTVIERFPVKDYVRAAEHQLGVSSQTAGGEQRMEALYRLLRSWAQPTHHAGITGHHAGKATAALQISQQIQGIVHQDSAASVSGLSPLPQARAGALTDEGQRKTIANKQTNTLGPSGVMADELSVDVGEREGFLRDVPTTVSAFAAGAASKIRKSPVATVVVASGTFITGTAYLVYDKFKASPPPASDAAVDVTPPAVTDLASVPDVQQSGNRTSKKEEFSHVPRPYTGYRRSESAEEADRLHKTSEMDVLNQLDKKPGPGYQRSAEKDWRRSESPEVKVLNR